MKRLLFIGLAFVIILKSNGQINMSDSTFQVIGYWSNKEKQSYIITHEKYKTKDLDTTSREFYKYIVDIMITDSTADSYTIDWFYHNYEIQTDNELIKKMSSIIEDNTITIKTDELGVFKEVINWKEVRDYIYKGTALLRKETKEIPNMDSFISQMESMYSSKASIESAAIKEIQQFYTFHGGKYKLAEVINAPMKVANLWGGKPFDTDVTLWLDQINSHDNISIIRMHQTINSEQLTIATFDYLTKMAKTMKTPPPIREEFPALKNETWVVSQIHGSGWVIYSAETKETSAEGFINVEETKIEII